MRDKRLWAAAAVLLLLAAAGGVLSRRGRLTARLRECAAQTLLLDKALRSRFPRAYENLGEPYLSAGGKCLALIEYHYRPCTPKELELAPASCGGPEADIGFYDVKAGRLLLSCSKAGDEARCGENVYGPDGKLSSFSPFPPETFPQRKNALLAL